MTSIPPQLLKNLEPVPVPQLEIEDYSVVVVHERERSRFLAGRRRVDRVGFVVEYAGDQLE